MENESPNTNNPKQGSKINFSGVTGGANRLAEQMKNAFSFNSESSDKKRAALIGFVAVSFILSAFTVIFYAKAGSASSEKDLALKTNLQQQQEIKELELANDQKDAELKEKDAALAAKETELMTKNEMLESINTSLKQANYKVSVIQKQSNADKNKIREYQSRLMDYENKFKTLSQEFGEIKKEREEDRKKIGQLVDQVRGLERDLASSRDDNKRLNTTIKNSWRCTDFEFLAGGKKQKNISFKKGKLHSLEINFILREAASGKPVTGDWKDLEITINGISETNNDYKRTTVISKMSGSRASVKLDKEKFSKGVYRVEVRQKGAVIGDAKFRAETVL